MRIFFIFLTLIYSKSLFSKEINLQFEIDWKSVHLADLEWNISLNKDNYSIDFVIQSYGMTDKIFKYKSVTNIEGLIENNQLHPLIYKSKTNKCRPFARHPSKKNVSSKNLTFHRSIMKFMRVFNIMNISTFTQVYFPFPEIPPIFLF